MFLEGFLLCVTGCRGGAFGWSLRLGSASSDVVPYRNVKWKRISHYHASGNTGEQQQTEGDIRSE